MSSGYFNVSGTDPSDDARAVYVWCRTAGRADHAIVATGHVVGAGGAPLPPGIRAGQFSVTFMLPAGCSSESLIVTADEHAKEILPDVTVTRCS